MQNDFVIRVKRAVKKVAALAGAALMASSVVSPVIAASLADLPRPFVSTSGQFNANVVVGSQTWNSLIAGDPAGVASDLAGAIDVAAAFAQKATGAVGAAGTVTLTRPQMPGLLKNSSGLNMGPGDSVGSGQNLFNSSVGGFEWMVNKTITYTNTSASPQFTLDLPVWESVSVSIGTLANDAVYSDYAGLKYNITSNGTALFPEGMTGLPVFGQNYQIIDATPTSVKFGQMSENGDIPFGTTVAIGTKATVRVVDWDTASNRAKVIITDADGSTAFSDYVSEGYRYENSSKGYSVKLKDVVISPILGNHVDLEWTTSSITLENGVNASSLSASLVNWTVSLSATDSNLSWLAFTSPAFNGRVQLSMGQSKDVMGYFNYSFEGWKDNNYTDIALYTLSGSAMQSAPDIYYWTNETTSRQIGINLDRVTGQWTPFVAGAPMASNRTSSPIVLATSEKQYYFQLWNASGPSGAEMFDAVRVYDVDNRALTNLTGMGVNLTSGMWSLFNTSGAFYNVSYNLEKFNVSLINWSSDASASYPGNDTVYGKFFKTNLYFNLSSFNDLNNKSSVSGTLTLTEKDGSTVKVIYEDGAINKVDASSVSGDNDVAIGGSVYTSYGTAVSRGSGSITIQYPENRREANLWVGRSSEEVKTYSIGDEIEGTEYEVSVVGAGGSAAINPITPGVGVVDTSLVFTSISKPTILVGGAAVNKGVYDLGSAGVPASEVSMNRAYIQLVENAYGTSQPVLVVAGYEKKDTRLACQLLAAKIAGLSSIAMAGNLVWLDTSGSTYSQVTVVQQ